MSSGGFSLPADVAPSGQAKMPLNPLQGRRMCGLYR